MAPQIAHDPVAIVIFGGLITSALLAVVVLGVMICAATWVRVPEDYLIRARTVEAPRSESTSATEP